MSTPFIIKDSEKRNKSDLEFGRMAEIELFNGQVNWWQSVDTIDINYVLAFISAIEEGTKVPTFSENDQPVYRKPSVASGIDFEEGDDFLC